MEKRQVQGFSVAARINVARRVYEGLGNAGDRGRQRSDDFVTLAPGSYGSGAMLCGIAVFRSGTDASSSTRAKQAITTLSAPARLRTETQALLVAPLVSTSSTSMICLPVIRSFRDRLTAIAPDNARARAFRPRPPSGAECFVRTSPSISNFAEQCFDISLASKAD